MRSDLPSAAAVAHVRADRPLAGSAGERAWRGLALIDGCLWYGRLGGLTRRPRARFDPDALVLVEPDGAEAAYEWDNHANAAAPAAASEWHLEGIAPSRYSGAEVSLHVGRQTAGHATSIRLAEGGWRHTLWEELPALAAYLAATPSARVDWLIPNASPR